MAKWFLQDCLLNQKQRKWDTIPNKPSVDSNNETYHRCMPAPSKRCAKWFLKGVNSPSLRVQTPPVGRCWWMVFFVENFTQRTKKQTKLEPGTRVSAVFCSGPNFSHTQNSHPIGDPIINSHRPRGSNVPYDIWKPTKTLR